MSGSTRTAVPDKTPDRIAGMFDAIAPRYDLLNRLLSAGIDRWWRKRAIDSLALSGREVLVDVATGTADVALEACAPRRGGARAARIVGVDFARAMLALGVDKVAAAGESSRIVLVHGDAMRLPVATGSADAVTIGMVLLTAHAARTARPPSVTTMSTPCPANAVASPGSCPGVPSPTCGTSTKLRPCT